ncbi:zinc ribbon domain-containing protein [Palleronia marisminoris]|uniref:zinc ribbon domain-containing protein n=1 Tax=Palleronia marisminoris TaxID=315423 RepID=UPI0023EA7666|nr:zinc ribbon domain-containing protein [Palleronia marisminoris]
MKARQTGIRNEIVAARSEHPTAPASECGRRPAYLLSGLLECGCCGAGYIKISATRYGCSAARNRGTCDNRRSIARTDLEARVLHGLKEKLMHPELVREFIAEFHREMQKDQTDAQTTRQVSERRLAKSEPRSTGCLQPSPTGCITQA